MLEEVPRVEVLVEERLFVVLDGTTGLAVEDMKLSDVTMAVVIEDVGSAAVGEELSKVDSVAEDGLGGSSGTASGATGTPNSPQPWVDSSLYTTRNPPSSAAQKVDSTASPRTSPPLSSTRRGTGGSSLYFCIDTAPLLAVVPINFLSAALSKLPSMSSTNSAAAAMSPTKMLCPLESNATYNIALFALEAPSLTVITNVCSGSTTGVEVLLAVTELTLASLRENEVGEISPGLVCAKVEES